MEKKPNSRSSQSQTKSQTNESKKSQDTSLNKPWPRWNKKRESTNNASGRNDTNRKPPSKGKNFDKRPRPRGGFHQGHNMAGITRTGLNEENVEVGSVFLPGSKKQNLNHLLNFQYTPRGGGAGAGRSPHSRRFHGIVYTNTHKHNNDLFLQSNCQFVVKADGDLKAHLIDPDVPVKWDLVEQINVRVCEPLTCPICLSELVAGRITRCGHAYCWPCLLHYFALSEDSHRPCPICFQPIDKTKLKSVQGVWQENIQRDGEICMTLMRRAQGSTIVEPVPDMDIVENHSPPAGVLSVSHNTTTLFAKLLTADRNEVSKIIERERKELSNQLAVESENPEYCFVQQALNLLEIRESLYVLYDIPAVQEQKPTTFTHSSDSGGLDFVSDFKKITLGQNNNDMTYCIEETNINQGVNNTVTNVSTTQLTENEPYKYFYFYQASDGQSVFLEGLEIRMLEMSWGSLKYAPRCLQGQILGRTSGSVSDESRRRLGCLRHLPIHCPFDMVQIDLKPTYVSPECILAFKRELEERKRKRLRKAREEKRLEKVVFQQEQKLLGQSRGMQLHLDSDVHFPAYQPDPVDVLSSQHFPLYATDENNDDDCDTPTSSISETSNNNLSFAKMASTSGTWKCRAPEVLATPAGVNNRVRYDSEASDTQESAPPSYNVSLSEAISAAMLNCNSSQAKSGDKEIMQGKKKKKHKAKVLFTTGIQHHNASSN